jgi:hypothetical protein
MAQIDGRSALAVRRIGEELPIRGQDRGEIQGTIRHEPTAHVSRRINHKNIAPLIANRSCRQTDD